MLAVVSGKARGGGGLTEVIRHAWHRAGHIRLGEAFCPNILQIALAANNWEAGTERDVETSRADDGVNGDDFATGEFDA